MMIKMFREILLISLVAALATSLVISYPIAESDEAAKGSLEIFKKFQKSPYYLPAYDATLGTMKQADLVRLRSFIKNVFDFLRNDLKTIVKPRGIFGAVTKGLGNAQFLLKLMSEAFTLEIAPVTPMSPDFLASMNRLTTEIQLKTEEILASKKYDASKIDKPALLARAEKLIDYFQNVIDASPVGIYLQWEWLDQSKNSSNPESANELVDRIAEIVDVYAQLRTIGYKPEMFDMIYGKVFGTGEPNSPKANPLNGQPMRTPIAVSN